MTMVRSSAADADQGADERESTEPQRNAAGLADEGRAAVGAGQCDVALARVGVAKRPGESAGGGVHHCHPFDFSTARAFDSAATVVVAGFLPMQLVLMSGA